MVKHTKWQPISQPRKKHKNWSWIDTVMVVFFLGLLGVYIWLN